MEAICADLETVLQSGQWYAGVPCATSATMRGMYITLDILKIRRCM